MLHNKITSLLTHEDLHHKGKSRIMPQTKAVLYFLDVIIFKSFSLILVISICKSYNSIEVLSMLEQIFKKHLLRLAIVSCVLPHIFLLLQCNKISKAQHRRVLHVNNIELCKWVKLVSGNSTTIQHSLPIQEGSTFIVCFF